MRSRILLEFELEFCFFKMNEFEFCFFKMNEFEIEFFFFFLN